MPIFYYIKMMGQVILRTLAWNQILGMKKNGNPTFINCLFQIVMELPYRTLYFLKSFYFFAFCVRTILGSQNAELTKPASKKEIIEFKKILSKYDRFIGSGSSAAIFAANELTLDIFFPYSMGIESFNEKFFLKLTKSKNFIVKLIASKMRNLQRQGIVRAKIAINADISVTKKAYDELGVEPVYVYPPHVYQEKIDTLKSFQNNLKSSLQN